jgi:hypothetical protein
MCNGVLNLDPALPIGWHERKSTKEMHWYARKVAHQSSVKCMAAVALEDSETVVISGGDDSSLAMTRFTSISSSHAPLESEPPKTETTVISTLNIPKAHASAITALALLPMQNPLNQVTRIGSSPYIYQFTLMTSSNDQRLKAWDIRIDLCKPGAQGIDVRKIANEHTSVADVSSMEVFADEGSTGIIVCGVGMELWRIKTDGTLKPDDALSGDDGGE